MTAKTALILAGHGSHISPHTAGLVWSYVDQLRAWGVADEVTAAFWKEPPAFGQVLDTVSAPDITIVPVFTAHGYFTKTVIPAEMRLNDSKNTHHGRTIHYTQTIGDHPYLETIVHQRVTDTLTAHSLDPAQAAIAIIGHGTKRSSSSRDAARAQANTLREQGLVAEVVDVYLDDAPDIPSVYRSTGAQTIIAVPYFLAPGSHVTIDVPEALGIDITQSPNIVNGRAVYYTHPVGTDDAICHLILELAREESGHDFSIKNGVGTWDNFPASGRDVLLETMHSHGKLAFGELLLTPDEVRPIAAGDDLQTIRTPAELRRFVHEEPFRPQPYSIDLPGGWRVEIDEPGKLHAVVETIYPGTVADWARHRQGAFQPEPLEITSQRQTGMFENIHLIDKTLLANTVNTICSNCARHASWYYENTPPGAIPCKAACNWLLSDLKEQVR